MDKDRIELRRLNMDSSWQLWWQGLNIVIDPWLIGSEVDGFSWLNEQWHVTEPVSMQDIGPSDLVLISQPYSDHCHAASIKELPSYKGMIAVRPARKRLQREIKSIAITEIPDITKGWLKHGPLEIADFIPDKWIDPIYHAIAIRCGDEAIFYSPHGFELNPTQLKALEGLRIRLLITTFSHFRIPAILGGLVNTGLDGVRRLADQIRPERIVNTHDEQKRGKGLIMALAKATYADMHAESKADPRVIAMEDYHRISL